MNKDQRKDEENLEELSPEELPVKEDVPVEEPTPLEELQKEFSQLSERHLRTLAEYDNYRKRSAKERENIYPQAKADALTGLLTVLDNFGRAMQTPCGDSEFKKGMEMIYSAFLEALENQGVKEIGQVGDAFDPNCHNAVMHVEDESLGENVVCEVFQKGYRLGERILRCAMVKVAN